MVERSIGADVLVIGSGMSGAATAAALWRHGRNVAVVSTGQLQAGAPDGTAAATPGWTSESRHYRPPPGLAGRIGGRARLWYGVVLPMTTDVLGSWPRSVGSDLRATYGQVGARLEAWKQAPLDAPTCVSDVEVGTGIARRGGRFRVVPTAARWTGAGDSRVWTAYAPIDDLPARRADADADERSVLLLDHHRVLWLERGAGGGVVARARDESTGAATTVHADAVVLAAGTLENTRLYAQALHQLAGQQVLRWPRLATKIKHGMLVRPAPWLTRHLGPDDLCYLMREVPALRGNLFLELRPFLNGGPYLDLWWLAEQTPEETATVLFDPAARVWTGRIRAGLGPTDEALTSARDSFASDLLRSWDCATAYGDNAVTLTNSEAKRRLANTSVRYRNPLGLSDHESGTIPLGDHLDDNFQSRVLPGIFVTGPAVFPRAGAANPGLTILAVAELTGERIHATLG